MIETSITAAGGLALFLLAMAMMTDGLKVFGGQGLKALLGSWTSSPLRGVASGALVTGIVQSSSAVTVATIGFVNAGVLSLRQALGVIFGANVGTTMTGWLVSLVGFGIKIEALALPILAVGVAFRLLSPGKRLQGFGNALAGFGLFFLGLAILKDAFSGFALSLGPDELGQMTGFMGLLIFVAFGFGATVLTQSSSAAIAIILTAAAQSVVTIEAAAAAIIGANIGTTSTALFAVFGATANAKRVAAGHLAFNLLTGLVALAILPLVLAAMSYAGDWAGLRDQPTPFLALFHTVFNLLGVALLLPFTVPLATVLERLFRSQEEDLSRPKFLDKTILATPALAIAALRNELLRLSEFVCALAINALGAAGQGSRRAKRQSEAIFALVEAIGEFATSMGMENLPQGVADDLPRVLRTARYLEEAARLAPEAEVLRRETDRILHLPTKQVAENLIVKARESVDLSLSQSAEDTARATSLAAFQEAYQETKSTLLSAAATHALNIVQVETLLDALSDSRRMVEQVAKASHLLQAGETITRSDAALANGLEAPG